jgi:Do/DeqQ family serine protease
MKIRILFAALLVSVGFFAGVASTTATREGQPAAGATLATPSPAAQPAVALAAAPRTAAAPPPTATPAQTAPLVGGPDFTAIAAKAVSAVTNISSLQIVRRRTSPFFNDPFFQQFFGNDEFFGGRARPEQSLGSGVLVSADGYMVTNKHVLGDEVEKVTVLLPDQRELPAQIVGVDSYTDLAVLKVDATDLPVLPWGDSSTLKVAEWVLAVGNPFQFSQTVTLGIVSALGRNVGLSTYEDFIQTDAAINPGNSGGALVNTRGELVGINTAIYSETGGYQGIGFAVPSNIARRVVDDIIRYGQVRRGSIGFLEVSPLTPRVARQLGAPDTDGLLVTRMRRDSEAYAAGIRPGDVIVTLDGKAFTDTQRLQRAIADAPIGGTVRVGLIREGRREEVAVKVGQAGRE